MIPSQYTSIFNFIFAINNCYVCRSSQEESRLDHSLELNDSIIDPSMAPQRKILEQYMKNQLDLNAEEIEQYEQMINSLAKKIDSKEEEIQSWKNKYEDLRRSLESTVSVSIFNNFVSFPQIMFRYHYIVEIGTAIIGRGIFEIERHHRKSICHE